MACHDKEYQRWCVEEARAEESRARIFDRRPRWAITSPNDPDFDPDDYDDEEDE